MGSAIFNVTDGTPALKQEVVAWLAQQLGGSAPLFSAPTGGEGRTGQAVPDRIINSSRIQQVLGWRPRFPDYRTGYADILHTDAPRF